MMERCLCDNQIITRLAEVEEICITNFICARITASSGFVTSSGDGIFRYIDALEGFAYPLIDELALCSSGAAADRQSAFESMAVFSCPPRNTKSAIIQSESCHRFRFAGLDLLEPWINKFLAPNSSLLLSHLVVNFTRRHGAA